MPRDTNSHFGVYGRKAYALTALLFSALCIGGWLLPLEGKARDDATLLIYRGNQDQGFSNDKSADVIPVQFRTRSGGGFRPAPRRITPLFNRSAGGGYGSGSSGRQQIRPTAPRSPQPKTGSQRRYTLSGTANAAKKLSLQSVKLGSAELQRIKQSAALTRLNSSVSSTKLALFKLNSKVAGHSLIGGRGVEKLMLSAQSAQRLLTLKSSIQKTKAARQTHLEWMRSLKSQYPSLACRGSTINASNGTFSPRNLDEQIAIKEAMSDPKKGRALPFKLKDKTWHHSEGWIKIEKLVKSNNGKTINIHYVRNENTGEMDDFKVIDEDLR